MERLLLRGQQPRPPTKTTSESGKLYGRLAAALEADWQAVARPSQLPPPWDDPWRVWLLMAGRGFGKTRAGAELVRSLVESGRAKRIALVAPTASDARDVMVEGESGILAVSPDWNRPIYEPSKRRVTWASGAIATTYSADEPDRLRGPQHDFAWCDELAAWRFAADAWDNLLLGLRLGRNPRVAITTTPKPVKIIRELLATRSDVVVTRGATRENEANLPAAFLNQIMARYHGTRLGRQELDAEVLEDVPGAFWTRDAIERCRVATAPDMARIIIAIDPSGNKGEEGDEVGIVACGIDGRGHAYVLEDASARLSPEQWARKAIALYRAHAADRIVAETNFGAAMVETVLRSVDQSIAFKAVTASRGKVVRAEPVAAIYEQGRAHHVGAFPSLEDQMASFGPDFSRATAGYSPDRVDALVWALTELCCGENSQGWVDHFAAMAAAKGKVELPAAQRDEKPISIAHALAAAQRPAVPTKTTVDLRAPHAGARFYVRKRTYVAGPNAIIRDVELAHAEALLDSNCGCVPLREDSSQ